MPDQRDDGPVEQALAARRDQDGYRDRIAGHVQDNRAVLDALARHDRTPRFRVGRSLGTTIYRTGSDQPCAWVPDDPQLAARIVDLLNDDTGPARHPAQADTEAG